MISTDIDDMMEDNSTQNLSTNLFGRIDLEPFVELADKNK